MITSFEVGAVFKILDQASPGLRKILAEVRELSKAIETARAGLAGLGKGVTPGIASATVETDGLAAAWRRVSTEAAAAAASITRASSVSRAAAASAAVPPVAGGGGGGRHRPGWLGGGGAHVGGPSVPLAGGGHARLGGGVGLALGAVGYAAVQAAKYDDAAFMMANHAGVDFNQNRARFRKQLETSSIDTGFGEEAVSLATQQYLRMMSDTGGDGVSNSPLMLRLAATEARRKGTTLEASMSSMTGLAHMLRAYKPEDVEKLGPAFTILSTRNPMSLPQMERAFGYAVPLLHSTMDLDPYEIMAMSTTMARSGITNTKSGTWIANMFSGALPGTSTISKMRFGKHEAALKRLGLVDENGRPTWMTDGHLDISKFFETSSKYWDAIPIEERGAVALGAFGKEGARAFAVMQDPAARDQNARMVRSMRDPRLINEVKNFQQDYNESSTVQGARTAMASFNATMAELGYSILPYANGVLKDFRDILARIRGEPTERKPGDKWGVATTAIEGAGIGAGVGLFAGGVGAPLGAALGAVTGGVAAIAHDYMDQARERPIDRYARRLENLQQKKSEKTVIPHITMTLDSKVLSEVVGSKIGEGHTTQAPAFDGMGAWTGGDSQHSDN